MQPALLRLKTRSRQELNLNLPLAKEHNGSVCKHILNGVSSVECDEGKVVRWGADPNVGHLSKTQVSA